MILKHQHSESSAIAAAFLKSLRNKITTAKADISTLPGSGHLNFALTLTGGNIGGAVTPSSAFGPLQSEARFVQ